MTGITEFMTLNSLKVVENGAILLRMASENINQTRHMAKPDVSPPSCATSDIRACTTSGGSTLGSVGGTQALQIVAKPQS